MFLCEVTNSWDYFSVELLLCRSDIEINNTIVQATSNFSRKWNTAVNSQIFICCHLCQCTWKAFVYQRWVQQWALTEVYTMLVMLCCVRVHYTSVSMHYTSCSEVLSG